MMTFGYKDGTEIIMDCDVMAICDGDSCYQLITFPLDNGATNTFILDYTQEKRDKLFEYVRRKGMGKANDRYKEDV